MLTRPDFIEKQIVVIFSSQLRGLRFANENLIVEMDGKIIEQASLHKIFAIFLIGEATITTKLIQELKSFNIALVLLRRNLTLIDVIGDDLNGNTLLRQRQYAMEWNTFPIAKAIVVNKLLNQEALLRKVRAKDEVLKDTADRLHSYAVSAEIALERSSLLGIEGNGAKHFFSEYYREMDWMRRSPRTKMDRNNLLLDMGYTFLFHFLETLLHLYGFDTYEGVYHTRFYERKSLVCDIQEPFRCIIDESLRRAYNLGQIDEKDFGFANGAYYIKGDSIQKYSGIFSRSILHHKVAMYDYVLGYYRHILGTATSPPYFAFH